MVKGIYWSDLDVRHARQLLSVSSWPCMWHIESQGWNGSRVCGAQRVSLQKCHLEGRKKLEGLREEWKRTKGANTFIMVSLFQPNTYCLLFSTQQPFNGCAICTVNLEHINQCGFYFQQM